MRKAADVAPMIVVPFRLPPDLVERLDAVARRMRAERPGVDITRADVVRMFLLRGLDDEKRRVRT